MKLLLKISSIEEIKNIKDISIFKGTVFAGESVYKPMELFQALKANPIFLEKLVFIKVPKLDVDKMSMFVNKFTEIFQKGVKKINAIFITPYNFPGIKNQNSIRDSGQKNGFYDISKKTSFVFANASKADVCLFSLAQLKLQGVDPIIFLSGIVASAQTQSSTVDIIVEDIGTEQDLSDLSENIECNILVDLESFEGLLSQSF